MNRLVRTDITNPGFQKLVVLLDADLKIRDGDEHAFYSQYNKSDSIRNVVVCYRDEEAVGCGAFKKYDEITAEIKRMYVLPAYRGQGIARSVLKELETWASEMNYKKCILETGINQPEAINLYKRSGYVVIKNYGQYQNAANSVCMQKIIRNTDE